MKKIAFFAAVAVLALASSASAVTMAELGGSTVFRATTRAAGVLPLQMALNNCGANPRLAEDGIYGPKTAAAIMEVQRANGLKVDGITGPETKTYAASCTPVNGTPDNGNGNVDLNGGAGSIDEYSLVAGYSNEEVGEDQADVKVAGLEIQNSDASDINVTAMKLVFDEGTAASDFEDYADEVSVWLGSTEVARVNADRFNDSNNWTATISFDENAIIKADKIGKLYVAISGINNLDSGDAGDTWTVDITSIRFVDGQGAVISEDPTVSATTFSFETFGAAANTEFKITEADEDINDAHVINVDATDDTNGVDILSFNVEIKGDSDVNLDDLPVTIDVTGATNVDDMATGFTLYMDGEEVGSASMSDCLTDADCSAVGGTEDYLFENMDLDLQAGQDYDFVVKADLLSVADALDEGDSIGAAFGETETDLATFKAKDEARNDLADADLTGTVTGDNSYVYDVGINLKLVEVDETKIPGDAAAATPESDSGLFTITFDVTAFDGDVYIDHSAPLASGGSGESDLTVTGTGTVTAVITSPSGATDGSEGFRVREGQTERFTVTTNILATASGFFSVQLGSLAYALTDVDSTTYHSFGLQDFKTATINLTDR